MAWEEEFIANYNPDDVNKKNLKQKYGRDNYGKNPIRQLLNKNYFPFCHCR